MSTLSENSGWIAHHPPSAVSNFGMTLQKNPNPAHTYVIVLQVPFYQKSIKNSTFYKEVLYFLADLTISANLSFLLFTN